MNLLTDKKISLTAGQIQELSEMFWEEANSQDFKIDNIIVFESGNVQVYYSDGNPKVKDISIYD